MNAKESVPSRDTLFLILLHQLIPTPALMWPAITVARSIPAVMFAENTSSSLVPAETGMERPVVIPEVPEPIARMPVRDGASVTVPPGTRVNMLVPAEAWYNWPVIVTVDASRFRAMVLLKEPESEVMTPSRGTENAMLSINVPSIKPPNAEMLLAEAPKPSAAPVLARPPKTVVIVAGVPLAKGIMAPPPEAADVSGTQADPL